MFIGIDVHKRYSQIAVLNENGEIVEEVRVENANLDDFAQQYAGSKAALEATSNYYHIHDTLSEYLDVTVANLGELKLISDSDKKTDRVDAKQLARMVRLGSIPESYVPTDEVRQARALVRGRQKLVENRTEYANKIHGLLSDHGITQEVKPLSVKGREFLTELSLPAPWDALLESRLVQAGRTVPGCRCLRTRRYQRAIPVRSPQGDRTGSCGGLWRGDQHGTVV